MNIRLKFLLITTLTLTLLFTTLYYAISTIIINSHRELEIINIENKINGVKRSFAQIHSDFSNKLIDWASWDDTYSFISDRNQQYIKSNLSYESMKFLDLDFIFFINTSDEVVFEAKYDHFNGSTIEVTSQFRKNIIDLKGAKTVTEPKSIIMIDNFKPVIVSALPILTNKGEGPAKGTIVYGRYIDNLELDRIGRLMLLKLNLTTNEINLSPGTQPSLKGPQPQKSSFYHFINNETVSCYTLFYDSNHEPCFYLNFIENRDIRKQAQKSLGYFVGALAIGGVTFFILNIFLINRFFANRIIKLSNEVKKISTNHGFSRVDAFGTDEISSLAGEINNLLTNIDKSNEELKKTLHELDIATRAKNDFLSNIGHELRTPITCIIGYTDILAESELSGELREFVNRIKLSSHMLISTVNDILDYLSIEGGELMLKNSEFTINNAFTDIINYAVLIATEKKLKLNTLIDKNIGDLNLSGDETRLKQIILNLVANALKFTSEGAIELGALLVEQTGSYIEVKFYVKDTGIGIAENKQKEIFLPFVQADNSSTRKYGGSGLGLTISDRLVTLLGGGKIMLESRPGQGSNFYFSIKIQKA